MIWTKCDHTVTRHDSEWDLLLAIVTYSQREDRAGEERVEPDHLLEGVDDRHAGFQAPACGGPRAICV